MLADSLEVAVKNNMTMTGHSPDETFPTTHYLEAQSFNDVEQLKEELYKKDHTLANTQQVVVYLKQLVQNNTTTIAELTAQLAQALETAKSRSCGCISQ